MSDLAQFNFPFMAFFIMVAIFFIWRDSRPTSRPSLWAVLLMSGLIPLAVIQMIGGVLLAQRGLDSLLGTIMSLEFILCLLMLASIKRAIERKEVEN